NGAGGFVGAPVATLTGVSFGLADFNGDGNLDAVGWGDYGSIAIAFGDGNGGFGPSGENAVFPAGAVIPGDFNGDGKADLWIASTSGPSCTLSVEARLRSGSSSFAAPQAFPSTQLNLGCTSTMSLVTADLNGDGHPDPVLVTADTTGGQATIQ